MRGEDRYLVKRGKWWHYTHRVPARYSVFDDRETVRISLKTNSLHIARERRDALEQADNDYWASLAGIDLENAPEQSAVRLKSVMQRRYESAHARATARGYAYARTSDLLRDAALGELPERIEVIEPLGKAKANRRERL
ncbi:MAG: DUF6538 domain-containing protein [Henriciella sp.]